MEIPIYQKIPNIYKRESLANGGGLTKEYATPEFEYLAENEWLFTEKVDGMNVRVVWNGYQLMYGSRKIMGNIQPELGYVLNSIFANSEVQMEQAFGEKRVVFFGEGFGGGIQNGHGYGPRYNFRLFDIMVNEKYVSRESFLSIAESFMIPVVPEVCTCKLSQVVERVIGAYTSVVAMECDQIRPVPPEGYVGVPKGCQLYGRDGSRVIVKIRRDDFCLKR